jgi:tRNA-(ms[2]io[6]A)-hydroxylase
VDWAAVVLAAPCELLNDHAHLERKASSNALDLLGRWPHRVELDEAPPEVDRWVHVLTSIAQDELRHLAQVLRILHRRGGHMTRAHENPYAAALHAHVRRGVGEVELHDRLMVSALIELRSCERFELLAAHASDEELRTLYDGLQRSERGHYKAFLDLARLLPTQGKETDANFATWLGREGEIMRLQPAGVRMHAGVEPA